MKPHVGSTLLTPIGVMEPQGTPPLAQGRETEADTPARSRNVLEKMLAVWSGEFPVPHPPCFRSSCWIQWLLASSYRDQAKQKAALDPFYYANQGPK
ncbi:hypothetical protein Y1Q_0011586 [Alligator mississippiensis]|uniref:Uncharacterized protein n=1 Tax=Alligator mississippiensis TaxID=8496 RepID=A0A151M0C4_ALLMI|nr:hypothetical protein Y1Q_0011586 [Alligator mississippiensis]